MTSGRLPAIAKQLVPEAILRRLRAQRVRFNRNSILYGGTRTVLSLVPDNVAEHYYHFLFDLALPLYLLFKEAPRQARFNLKASGPFIPRLNLLFPSSQLHIQDDPGAQGPERRLLGMNPLFVHLTNAELLGFADHVRSVLGVQPRAERHKVLLIERLPTEPFFTTAAVKRGGGASRRSIPNHEELAARLSSLVVPPFEFQNVRLEQIGFEQQVELFAGAAVVVGQHGAGLGNCLWMLPGSQVIELNNNPDKLSHFRKISTILGHGYMLHQTRGPHSPVDIDALTSQLRQAPNLGRMFGEPNVDQSG